MARYIDADAYEFSGDLINEPTVDVVEVVRCKDCKFYSVSHLACKYPHHNGTINIDGYCSYGEMRETE